MATLRISLKKVRPRLNLLNGSRLYCKTITCEKKKILPFDQFYKVTPPLHHPKNKFMSKLMPSNPAFTERNIQKANAYLLYSRQEQKSLVTYHTLQSLYVCVWLVHTLTSTAPIESPIICMWSPADICEQCMGKKFIFQFSRRSWGRNTWRTPKNVCVGGYRRCCLIISSIIMIYTDSRDTGS